MKSVQIQLTTKCNERCFMCRKYTWKHKEISLRTLENKIEKYKNATFTFSGGDALAFTHIKELNKIIEKYNISYQVFTNLTYALDSEMMKFLKKADYVQVSCDGSCKSIYDHVRRPVDEDAFDVLMYNINNNLDWMHDKLKINVTVSNRNYDDVEDIAKMFIKKSIMCRFFPVHTDKDAMLNDAMFQAIENQIKRCIEFDEFAVEKYTNLKTFEFREKEKYTGPCYVKLHHRIIDENGDEYTCCRAINDNGEDWESMFTIDKIANVKNVNVLYPYCDGCDRYRKFNQNWEKYSINEKIYL